MKKDTDRVATTAARLNARMGPTRQTRRTREEIARYFDGLDLVDPRLAILPEWRALASPRHVIACYAGVGRKPRPRPHRGSGYWVLLPSRVSPRRRRRRRR